MKSTTLTKAADKVVSIKLRAVDKFIEEIIDPLADVGNPEKLIKKPYESWTPEDLALLIKIYGTEEPNPLSNLIFRRQYEKVKRLEEEEL